MQKQKRWQLYLIIAVIALTIYNILPTVFYYAKPLKQPIDQKKAENVAQGIVNRVDDLESESLKWVESFCKLLNVKPLSIEIDKNNPADILVNFAKIEEAKQFKKYLPRAGALIPFTPSQLALVYASDDTSKTVHVQRQIPIQFNPKVASSYFQFAPKKSLSGLSTLYKDLVFDRTAQIALAACGPSQNAIILENIMRNPSAENSLELAFYLAKNILENVEVFQENSSVAARYFASFSQSTFKDKSKLIQSFIESLDNYRSNIKIQKADAKQAQDTQTLQLLERKENILMKAEDIVKNNLQKFTSGSNPWDVDSILAQLDTSYKNSASKLIVLDSAGKNPFVSQIVLDWTNDKVYLNLYKDVVNFKTDSIKKDRFDQLLINEIANITRASGEKIVPGVDEYTVSFNDITESSSFLALKLTEIAKIQVSQIKNILLTSFKPKSLELALDSFPIYDYDTYKNLTPEQKKLCFVVFAPVINQASSQGFNTNAIYIVAKGLDKILQKYQGYQSSDQAKILFNDFNQLQSILKQNGFLGFSGKLLTFSSEFSNDFIFEKDDYYSTILSATREQFSVHGSKKYAILEFTNVEQRILALNKIETRIQEDLLKTRDDYNAAQISIYPENKFDVPKPIKNVFLSNLLLSTKKYLRGDDRKIIHWGLDLSGGKTVQIELRDKNNRVVTDETAIKQGINELYNRVNKMGVSEVSIRSLGNNIVLDFPGSQELSAAELIKASTMYFNIVNEKFSNNNPQLADSVNSFLQEVWNEAVVTNKKDIASINAIAYKHLYGESLSSENPNPRSESAKVLYDNGLRLSLDQETSSAFNDTFSKIALFRGNDFISWQNQTNPLLIVFNNYVIDGSDLDNIRGSYDPSKGNYLSFDVKGSYTKKDGQKVYPREDLNNWTSHFSKEKVLGTALEKFSRSKGWRMAVILNDTIISAPNLESTLKDSAMISGNFSVREVNQLVADLKAGSMSFTPHILSEQNVSPDLGKQERLYGIVASCISIALVILLMMSYYRFGGIVASIAVLFNLLIIWATLQNLGATLTLASIAGIVLTVGMAVDANVLVFERIKEELSTSNRLISAIQNGYTKAFSAIFDSNVTTIIAALILLHFDSGPIKGFAVTLIIGIVSSLFTALFLTRYFFNRWSQNPSHTTLKMSHWIKPKNFNFLKNAKYLVVISAVIIIVGNYLLIDQRKSIFGMDFTGGFSLNLELKETPNVDYRQAVEKALFNAKATSKDFQIRELTPANNLRLLFGVSMENPTRPFYNMPIATAKQDVTYGYENNPRIVWILDALKKQNLTLTEKSLSQLDQNWTVMSGQMSDSMRNNAIYGLALALLCIFIYITFRFEFKYAFSALVCLVHDVLIALGSIAILNVFGVEIQIDLVIIAAIMTIIGYSLNDTIVVFDRIREDVKLMRKNTFTEVVNHAINITLNRTIMTSSTVLVALFGLVILGKSTLFGFALVMLIGVVFGTLSSIFIASPLMLILHNRELKKEALKRERIEG